ncbi:hypothetical protein A9Q81_11835 [Gammaproteobacteria bacterium 42_54_T18]|nr:hypothetical protein A9Q81_11835 [Gammaproteobacteria bacterium 42_54_T18]
MLYTGKMNLLNETNRLLSKYKYSDCKRISIASDVNFHWLATFRKGGIAEPGVQKVQKLHDALLLMEPKPSPANDSRIPLSTESAPLNVREGK